MPDSWLMLKTGCAQHACWALPNTHVDIFCFFAPNPTKEADHL